jgi:hypothetical protein
MASGHVECDNKCLSPLRKMIKATINKALWGETCNDFRDDGGGGRRLSGTSVFHPCKSLVASNQANSNLANKVVKLIVFCCLNNKAQVAC